MPLTSGPSPTRDQLRTLIRGFLINILPTGTAVVIGQANRVPQPQGDNSVVIMPPNLKRLATTADSWARGSSPPDTSITHQQDVGAGVQLQVFGENSADNVNTITTLLRNAYATEFFNAAKSGIAPLYCDDGQQIPFITGEDQFQDRYIVEAMFQMSVQMATGQQFADMITVTGVNIDVAFPPV